MQKTILAAATIAALLTGHYSRALANEKITIKGQPVEVTDKTVRALLCRAEWNRSKDDPKLVEQTKYGSQYFVKQCKAKLANQ